MAVMPLVTSSPFFLKEDSAIPKITVYFAIPIGEEKPAAPMTAVFVPDKGTMAGPWDVILWLHGFKDYGANGLGHDWGIDRVLARPAFQLRELINSAGKSQVIIAPTLGPHSQYGTLATAGDQYLDQVLDAFGNQKLGGMKPKINSLTLACHSGGGKPMLAMAETMKTNIDRCWGFDCMYNAGFDVRWKNWATTHPNSTLKIYYLPRTQTEALSTSLQRLSAKLQNVVVKASKAPAHNDVPLTELPQNL